ncbi:hypothetical protein RDWZM_004742 [Blomia tropicalis]|uniref:Uncharacterized protein n=1 Tax=Blomia tropicalis TaxID=40697 RepID=A0A9Q0M7P3_BLOTA|nr:hypothetical protein RDWZM_004742 [Blomia tropicalis]
MNPQPRPGQDPSDKSHLQFYPFDERDYLNTVNSMKQFHDQPLHFRLPFFGFAYHYIWIHKDGYVSFNRGLKSYQFPVSFPVVPADPKLEEDPSMMAIFFAHQDIPSEIKESGVYFRIENVGTLQNEEYKNRILEDFDQAMAGSGGFVPKFVIIVTWKNMTFANKRPDKPLKTNTYQMVIGTDEINTFVFYNYQWITWITHLDNFDGLNGPAAYVGFNAGNTTRTYEFSPYSQNPRISLLPLIGYANNIKGRAIFQVHDVLFQGSCVEKSLDPTLPDRMAMTTSVNYVTSLGKELLEVTGPCFTPEARITCRFETIQVKGHYKTNNVAYCVTPQVLYEGYIDLTVTVDDKTFFYTRLYIQSPESKREFEVWVEEKDYLEKNPDLIDASDHQLTIKWKNEKMGKPDERVTISIWAYQELDDTLYPQMIWILDLVTGIPNNGIHKLDLNQLPQFRLHRYDYHFGFIGVNKTGQELTATFWSNPIPLGWLLRKHWQVEFGRRWQTNFCQKWYEREDQNEYFATTLFRCPCTLAQAELDKGRFAPDERCNVVDKKCDSRHVGAQHCIRSARPSIGGSGQQCCYDDYGELIRSSDTMYGGRPSRSFIYGQHPFKMSWMTPTLSYWQQDIMPFYYCCKWSSKEDDSETCKMFNYFRTSQDCSNYQSTAIASVFGDPHIVTFDQLNYTFNGKGEYVLVHTDSPIHKLDIHGRFEQLPNLPATQLTAVAIRDNISSIVEFRIRPDGCRWFNQMFLIADKEYLYYWDDNMRTIHTRGVTLLINPAGTLTLHVYLPNTYINSTKGLLGYYSGNVEDDFMLPNGRLIPNPSTLSRQQIHQDFGIKYRLLETNQLNLSQSLFFHDVVSHSIYDDHNFEPIFDYSLDDLGPDIIRTCSDSLFCQYDYAVTGDSDFAANTKKEEAASQNMYSVVNAQIVRCPALDKPNNGRKSSNRYWTGTIVRFSCNDGYRLVGYEVRRCREDGLWSWGVDAHCLETYKYSFAIAGIIAAFIFPFLVIVFLAVVWIRVSKRYPDDNRRLRQTIRTKADDYFNFFKIRTSWLAPTKATFDDMDDEQSKIGKKMNDDIEHKDIEDDDESSQLNKDHFPDNMSQEEVTSIDRLNQQKIHLHQPQIHRPITTTTSMTENLSDSESPNIPNIIPIIPARPITMVNSSVRSKNSDDSILV